LGFSYIIKHRKKGSTGVRQFSVGYRARLVNIGGRDPSLLEKPRFPSVGKGYGKTNEYSIKKKDCIELSYGLVRKKGKKGTMKGLSR